jgi:glutaredoxin
MHHQGVCARLTHSLAGWPCVRACVCVVCVCVCVSCVCVVCVVCVVCRAAKALLQECGVPLVDIDLDRYPERRREMVERTNQRTVPQIFFNAVHSPPLPLPRRTASSETGGGLAHPRGPPTGARPLPLHTCMGLMVHPHGG